MRLSSLLGPDLRAVLESDPELGLTEARARLDTLLNTPGWSSYVDAVRLLRSGALPA